MLIAHVNVNSTAILLLQRSTAMQVRSAVQLMPQNQPSGKGLLPSPHSLVARSAPCGHVSWHLSAYFGQDWRTWSGVWSACPHSHREVSEMPVLFRWALRPQCPVRRRKIEVCWALDWNSAAMIMDLMTRNRQNLYLTISPTVQITYLQLPCCHKETMSTRQIYMKAHVHASARRIVCACAHL